MGRNFRRLAYSVVVLMVFTVIIGSLSLAAAKGNFSKLVVSGSTPPIKVTVTDPALLDFFSVSDFPNMAIEKPAALPEGYVILRGWDDEHGQFTIFDMLYYYPGKTAADSTIFYVGLVNGGSEYDGKWYRASADGDKALRQVLGLPKAASDPASESLGYWYFLTQSPFAKSD